MTAATGYTVGDAVPYWLGYGLSGRDPHTVHMYRTYAETHTISVLGKRKLRELTVEDVEKLLTDKSEVLNTCRFGSFPQSSAGPLRKLKSGIRYAVTSSHCARCRKGRLGRLCALYELVARPRPGSHGQYRYFRSGPSTRSSRRQRLRKHCGGRRLGRPAGHRCRRKPPPRSRPAMMSA